MPLERIGEIPDVLYYEKTVALPSKKPDIIEVCEGGSIVIGGGFGGVASGTARKHLK